MKFQHWMFLVTVAALFSGAGEAATREKPSRRMNLISIVTDDQSHWSVGAYGNRASRTPNMDRLAREGARFTNAFVASPVCSPSRASFLTGLHSTQIGITDWISPKEAQEGLGLPPETVTWPEVLQRHGYATALIGKWHLGEQPQYHPTKHGYDRFVGFKAGGHSPMNPHLEIDDRIHKLTGPLPDRLTDHAVQFVEENRSRPFALSLHFRASHLPYGPVPEEDSAPFAKLDPAIPDVPEADRERVKNWTREYYASIHSVDRNIGRLLRRLDELGLAKNTIVMFTSDHGYMIGHHNLHTKGNAWFYSGPSAGVKRPNMFEESIRIPLIVRWPGAVKPGRVIPQTVSNLDTYASVLGMLNVPAPEGHRQEGRDFSPLLRGKRVKGWRDALFGQYDLHNGGRANMRMIRTGDWKLVRHYGSEGKDELYHLKTDPGERRNRYGETKYRPVRDRLQKRLTEWMRSLGDPILSKVAVEGLL